jgi:hypothetical protein
VYQRLQEDPSEKTLDDRPEPDADIPPISFIYEGFGHFMDILNGCDNVPGLADVDVWELQKEVDELTNRMTGYFATDDDRKNAALPCLDYIFSARRGVKIPLLHPAAIGSVRTYGHNTAIHGAGAMVVVCKNWSEGIGISSLPQIELVGYAARLHATRMNEVGLGQLYLRWRVPSVGLTIVGELDICISLLFDVLIFLGCLITFYAIIAIDQRFRIVSLTTGYSCISSASGGRDRTFLYSAFTAASVLQACILQDAERLLNDPPAALIPVSASARHFPAVSKLRKYPLSSDNYFSFEIQCFFPNRQPDRLVYIAREMPDKRLVLIKFAPQYSIELHEFCANSGHVPLILAFEQLSGGWCAVAMEYIESGLPITHPSLLLAHRDRWAAELQRLMDDFHNKDYVHGDLRAENIICKGESMMLVDFDWGSKDREVFYPRWNLDDELLQGRTSNNLKIRKEDDRRVLTNTLAKLENIESS